MLSRLFVRNFALVENLEICFDKNFIVLTGETGAGKSLLIGAISYLLGAKFDPSLLLKRGEECIIEGTFTETFKPSNKLGLESEEPFTVKRKFDRTGKSWAFLNGETISLNRLKSLVEELIEINGQHQEAKLLDERNHLEIVDSLNGVSKLSKEIGRLASEIREKLKLLKLAEGKASEINMKIKILEEEIGEIDKINPKENEDEELKIRKKIVENSSRIYENLLSIATKIKTEENSILPLLRDVIKKAEELAGYKENWKELHKELENSRAVLSEIYNIVEKEIESLDFEPDELEKIQERLYQIEKLERKYGPGLNDVISRRNSNLSELNKLKEAGFDKDTIRKEVEESFKKFISEAKTLSKARSDAAKLFSKNVTAILKNLALEKGRFEVNFIPLRIDEPIDITEHGLEDVNFMFSANLGEPPLPLSRIASGGELSRIMLAILTAAKGDYQGRTIIFDEIDAGIGGKPAEKVGIYLHRLSLSHQVICVTHLPQIAAYADQHIKIEKTMKEEKTTVCGKTLSEEERIEELGRMVAGEKITQSAVIYAKELLKIAEEKKKSHSVT